MIQLAHRLRSLIAGPDRSGQAPRVEILFRQRCGCGHELAVPRTSHGQAIDCPHCGAPHYVLPASAWTPPVPPRGTTAIEWEPGGHRPPPPPVAEPQPAETAEPGPRLPEVLAQVPNQLQTAVARQVRYRPLRWIVVGAIVLVAVTIVFSWRAARRRQAAANLERLTNAGAAQLDEGNYSAAERTLRAAAEAATDLPGETPLERRAVQLHREAIIWSHLSAQEPADFFLRRVTDPHKPDRDAWPRQFVPLLGGRTIILDAWVSREADAQWNEALALVPAAAAPVRPRLRLDWALVGGDERLEVVLPDDPMFAAVAPGRPQRMIFGARIGQLRGSLTRPALWLLELTPGSCVPLTDPGPLSHQGWPADDASRAILATQAKSLGVAP